ARRGSPTVLRPEDSRGARAAAGRRARRRRARRASARRRAAFARGTDCSSAVELDVEGKADARAAEHETSRIGRIGLRSPPPPSKRALADRRANGRRPEGAPHFSYPCYHRATMSRDFSRYHRQMLLSGFGEEGQRRLAESTAVVLGCGALGTVVADMLARAGVGRLVIIDRDFVEMTNLQRQVLFDEADAAEALPKAEAARRKLARINSDVEVEAIVD